MSVIHTFKGHKFDVIKPTIEMIDPEDIAHSLSFLCRFVGHVPFLYSVGLHSVICMNEAHNRGLSKRIQLACLLHDASEAYLSDISRSFKQYLNDYKLYENRVQDLIYRRFGLGKLSEIEQKYVEIIDYDVLGYEIKRLFGRDLPDFYGLTQDYVLETDQETVKTMFLNALNDLVNSLNNKENPPEESEEEPETGENSETDPSNGEE